MTTGILVTNPLSKYIELIIKQAAISALITKILLFSHSIYHTGSSIPEISHINKDFMYSANLLSDFINFIQG